MKGPLLYTIMFTFALLLFWRNGPIGTTAVAMMSGGDGMADLVGRNVGRAKLPWNKQKTWAGSIAMFLSEISETLLGWVVYQKCGSDKSSGHFGGLSRSKSELLLLDCSDRLIYKSVAQKFHNTVDKALTCTLILSLYTHRSEEIETQTPAFSDLGQQPSGTNGELRLIRRELTVQVDGPSQWRLFWSSERLGITIAVCQGCLRRLPQYL